MGLYRQKSDLFGVPSYDGLRKRNVRPSECLPGSLQSRGRRRGGGRGAEKLHCCVKRVVIKALTVMSLDPFERSFNWSAGLILRLCELRNA